MIREKLDNIIQVPISILLILFLILVPYFMFKIIILKINNLDKNIIFEGRIVDYKHSKSSGKNATGSFYKIKGNDGVFYWTQFYPLNAEINSIVKFRRDYKTQEYVRLLSINGIKVNTYYGFFDYFSLIFVLAFLGFTPFVIRKIYDRYFRMNMEKRKYFKNRGY